MYFYSNLSTFEPSDVLRLKQEESGNITLFKTQTKVII